MTENRTELLSKAPSSPGELIITSLVQFSEPGSVVSQPDDLCMALRPDNTYNSNSLPLYLVPLGVILGTGRGLGEHV